MEVISLSVNEFLNYVCFQKATYEDMYKYIYRKTNFEKEEILKFKKETKDWIKQLENKRLSGLDFFDILALDNMSEVIKKENPYLDAQLQIIEKILKNKNDPDIEYYPTLNILTTEDCDLVNAALHYVDPLLNGVPVMDGYDYLGEILNDEKMIKGAKIIQQLYERYKDFRFDILALDSHPSGYRLHSFCYLFDTYDRRVRFILEFACIPEGEGNKDIYKYDVEKISQLYNFCNKDVFDIDFATFVNAVSQANFSIIYKSENIRKNKLAYLISVIKNHVHSTEWYKKAANSIEIEPAVCTKKNVPEDWKKAIKAIK